MRHWSPVARRHVKIGAFVAVSLAILVLLYIYDLVIIRPEVSGAEITTPEGFAAAWTAFTNTWITPLQDSATGYLALVAGFVILARLLSLLPLWNTGVSDRMRLRAALGLGLAFVVVAPLALVSLTPRWHLALIMGLAGSTLLAAYTARRMVLRIEVTSEKGEADAGATAQLAAFVAELGRDSPKGRWLPQASDATGFQKSEIVGLPSNAFFAVALGIIQSLAGTAPWRIVVCRAGDGSLGVEITRNRHGIETVNVSRRILTESVQINAATDDDAATDDAADDAATVTDVVPAEDPADGAASNLHRLAAAFILMQVSRKYSGFDGLCGATDWRSVGLHFIATTDALNNKARATRLLTRAVDDDPKNLLAVLALNWRQHRYATDADEIKRHIAWLLGQFKDIEGKDESYATVRYRLLLNYLTAVCTLRSIPGHDDAEQQAGMQALSLLAALHDQESALAESMRHLVAVAVHRLIPDVASNPPQDFFASGKSKHVTWFEEEWQGNDWLERARKDADPHVKYALACHYAQLKPPQLDESLSLLDGAVEMPDLRAWAADDPALRPLHQRTEFAGLVGRQPRASWLEVEPFAWHRPKLEKIGIVSPEQLVGTLMQPLVVPRAPAVALAAYLGVGALELTALLRAARFCMAVEGQQIGFGSFQVEVTAELLRRGITEILQVTMMTVADRNRTAEEISASIATRCVAGPQPGTVAAWLGSLYPDVDIL